MESLKTSNDDRNSKKHQKTEIESLISDLMSNNGVVRENARGKLLQKGKDGTEYVIEIVNHPNDRTRWEATKLLAEIAEPDTAPFLLDALEDEVSSIRWLAAEGLIALKKTGLIAVLEALVERKLSYFLRKGAHHVLVGIKRDFNDKKLKKLIKILNQVGKDDRISIVAEQILDELRNESLMR